MRSRTVSTAARTVSGSRSTPAARSVAPQLRSMSGSRCSAAREREVDGVADRQLVDAHDGVRAGRGFDVVVVRLVLEAVEAQVFEPVGGAAHVERGAEVVEADVGFGLGAVRVAQDLVRQLPRLHDQLHDPGVDRYAVLGDHRDGELSYRLPRRYGDFSRLIAMVQLLGSNSMCSRLTPRRMYVGT